MNISELRPSIIPANGAAGSTGGKEVESLRLIASQFEALLLSQLTATMNSSSEEDGLFSNSGGMGMSKQMFGEQFAQTMAQNGGIGLADIIMNQLARQTGTSLQGKLKEKGLGIGIVQRGSVNSATPVVAASVSEPANSMPPGKTNLSITIAPLDAKRARRVHTAPGIETNPQDAISKSKSVETLYPTILNRPINGTLRSGFGPRRDPINGRMRFHKGVDIVAPSGTPIGAAAEGRVVFSGRNKGYGNMVMIEHTDGRRTLYAHAQRLFVKAGDQVRRGQTIAAVGSTGHSTGPHLHFEVRAGNVAVNPLKALANGLMVARR